MQTKHTKQIKIAEVLKGQGQNNPHISLFPEIRCLGARWGIGFVIVVAVCGGDVAAARKIKNRVCVCVCVGGGGRGGPKKRQLNSIKKTLIIPQGAVLLWSWRARKKNKK